MFVMRTELEKSTSNFLTKIKLRHTSASLVILRYSDSVRSDLSLRLQFNFLGMRTEKKTILLDMVRPSPGKKHTPVLIRHYYHGNALCVDYYYIDPKKAYRTCINLLDGVAVQIGLTSFKYFPSVYRILSFRVFDHDFPEPQFRRCQTILKMHQRTNSSYQPKTNKKYLNN